MEEKKTNKVKEFVKKHKGVIIWSGCAVAMTVGASIIVKSLPDTKALKLKGGVDEIDLDKLGLLGRIIKVEEASRASAWFEDDSVDIANIEYSLSDMGKIGESLIETHSEMFKPEDKISGILVYTK